MQIFSCLLYIVCLSALEVRVQALTGNILSNDDLNIINHRDLYDVEGFLISYGYPFESHEVVTEDGYILTVHRVPYGRNETSGNTTRPPVLVMHGILCCSINFMSMGPGNSVVLMLADAGYDVWAGNNRGNTWSRKHVTLNPDTDPQFWNFSYHELGYYDDTAMIDYILNVTDNEKLFYVGHSQGTTQFFAMASTRPEYNDKILLMSALAPVVHCNYLTQPGVRLLAANYNLFDLTTRLLGITEILPHSSVLVFICQQVILVHLCALVLFALMGYDPQQLSTETVSQFYQNFPDGTSIKGFKHLIQGTAYGVFSQYNYGSADANLIIYGHPDPPLYNISLVTSPVALYYAENDPLSAIEDVDRLSGELPNLVRKYLVEYDLFTHGDYMYATDFDEVVNSVLSLMEEISNNGTRCLR